MKYTKNVLYKKNNANEIKNNAYKKNFYPNKKNKFCKNRHKTLNNNYNNSYSKKYNTKSKENKKHSLTEIAKLVFDFIKKEKITTVDQICVYILNTLKLNNSNELRIKTIKKRVYKSIEVMTYKIIKKHNKRIEYIDYNCNKNNKNMNLKNIDEEFDNINESEAKIIEEYNKKKYILKKLKKILFKKYEKIIEIQKKINENTLKYPVIFNKEFKINCDDAKYNSNSEI